MLIPSIHNMTKFKGLKGLATGVCMAVLGLCVLLGAPAEGQVDLEIETDAAFADSEGAIAEAEEAERREQEERRRAKEAREQAVRETERARKLEQEAKAKIAIHLIEEKKYKHQRIEAEKKTQVSLEKIRRIEADLAAKEIELQALRDATQRSVIERDQAEAKLQQLKDRVRAIEAQFAEEKRRKTINDEQASRAKQGIDSVRSKLKGLRKPAGVGSGRVAGRMGWIRLRQECGLHSSADSSSSIIHRHPAGDRFYGKRFGSAWIQVLRKADSSGQKEVSGFIPINCLQAKP